MSSADRGPPIRRFIKVQLPTVCCATSLAYEVLVAQSNESKKPLFHLLGLD